MYAMKGYNRWKQRVIKPFREAGYNELFSKYLEIKMNSTKTYNAILGSIIGMALAIMAGVTINVISECDPNTNFRTDLQTISMDASNMRCYTDSVNCNNT